MFATMILACAVTLPAVTLPEAALPVTEAQVFHLTAADGPEHKRAGFGNRVGFVCSPDGDWGFANCNDNYWFFTRSSPKDPWQPFAPQQSNAAAPEHFKLLSMDGTCGWVHCAGEWYYKPTASNTLAFRLKDSQLLRFQTYGKPQSDRQKALEAARAGARDVGKLYERAEAFLAEEAQLPELKEQRNPPGPPLVWDATDDYVVYTYGFDQKCRSTLAWLHYYESNEPHPLQPYGGDVVTNMGPIRMSATLAPGGKYYIVRYSSDPDHDYGGPDRVHLFTRDLEFIEELFIAPPDGNATLSSLEWIDAETMVFCAEGMVAFRRWAPENVGGDAAEAEQAQ